MVPKSCGGRAASKAERRRARDSQCFRLFEDGAGVAIGLPLALAIHPQRFVQVHCLQVGKLLMELITFWCWFAGKIINIMGEVRLEQTLRLHVSYIVMIDGTGAV